MSVMTITRRMWDPLYSYKVDWNDAYRLYHTQAVRGPIDQHKMQGPFYVMRATVQHYLEDLPEVKIFGISMPACRYQYKTGRLPMAVLPDQNIDMVPPPPSILMARKSDALMLKLACAGH